MAALAVAHVDGAARPYRRRVLGGRRHELRHHELERRLLAVLSGRADVEDRRLEAARRHVDAGGLVAESLRLREH